MNLALRMRSHEARTHTIVEWTGLSYARVRRLVRSYARERAETEARGNRGPSPNNAYKVVTSRRSKAEAAAMIGICFVLGVFPEKSFRNVRKDLPGLGRGERLCRAFELYRSVQPLPELSFEQLVMLVIAVAQGSDILVNHCEGCGAVILGVRYGPGRWHCTHCDSHSELHADSNISSEEIPSPENYFGSAASVRRSGQQTH